MKNFLVTVVTILLFASTGSAQVKTIINLLNTELNKAMQDQFKNPAFAGDTIVVIHPYTIDTAKKLSVTVKRFNPEKRKYTTITQEVPLKKIKQIGKNGIVVFTTGNKEVTTSQSSEDREWQDIGNVFYTWFSGGTQNEVLAQKLKEAFKKAGFTIEKYLWND